MTDSLIAMWLAIMLVIDLAAIVATLALCVSGKVLDLCSMLRVGVLLVTFGLGVQIVRSLHYFGFGTYPVDKFFPWWILKDLGGSLIIFYLTFIWRQAPRQPVQPQRPQRTPARTTSKGKR